MDYMVVIVADVGVNVNSNAVRDTRKVWPGELRQRYSVN